MSEIAKEHSHSGSWEHICREIPLYHVENHPQSDLVLDLVCALAPQPRNLHHCHLKNILVGDRRDSNSSFKFSYLCLRFCHHAVAMWKGTFSSIINEPFLSLQKGHIRSLHLGLVWTVRGLFPLWRCHITSSSGPSPLHWQSSLWASWEFTRPCPPILTVASFLLNVLILAFVSLTHSYISTSQTCFCWFPRGDNHPPPGVRNRHKYRSVSLTLIKHALSFPYPLVITFHLLP